MSIKLVKGLFDGDGVLTQGFGENPSVYAKFGLKGHNGVDYGIPTGTKLYSCIEGKVVEAQLDPTGYGNYIKIENDDCGVLYGHLKSFQVKVGDVVKVGQVLGLSDNTGNSTGPHLHFGVFPKPRDRGNGYAGYIDPFDKTQITWIDSYVAPAPVCDCTALEKELDDMRTSRDKWKAKYEELDSSSTADIIAKSKHIEELQKTIAEQNSQLTLNTGAQDAYAKDVEALKKDLATSNQNAQVLKEQNEALTKENSHLSDLLKSLQDKGVENMTNETKDYSQYKILAWRYLRVFMSTFLVSLASGLVGATDVTAIKALVLAGIAAGITALAKNFRDQVSDGDVTNLVNKMPL